MTYAANIHNIRLLITDSGQHIVVALSDLGHVLPWDAALGEHFLETVEKVFTGGDVQIDIAWKIAWSFILTRIDIHFLSLQSFDSSIITLNVSS